MTATGSAATIAGLGQPFLVPGQLEEHVFQRHGNRFEFDEPPVVGDSQPSNVFPDVFAQVAFKQKMSCRPIRVHMQARQSTWRSRASAFPGGRVRVRAIFSEWRSRVDNRSGSVLGDNAPTADDDDALADRGGFRENVSAQDHGMRSCQAFDEFPDLDDLFGVEADGRLV